MDDAGDVPLGRFAPSPTGELHLGNLRTALAAWLFARSSDSGFVLRMEDLDRNQSSGLHEDSQKRDLTALGLDWDGEVVRQSERFDLYEDAISDLSARGLTYRCYCTRREIREAASAPNGPAVPDGAYPGTCRNLDAATIRTHETAGRPPAIRLRAQVSELAVDDMLLGRVTAAVDDVVLRRNDGVPAYNLAVVVDDAAQGVEQVVRGDDLASSAPRQRHLANLLGLQPLSYAHVSLVVGGDGVRLAKRDGATTLSEQRARGVDPRALVGLLAASLGQGDGDPCTPRDLLASFDPTTIPRSPWHPADLLT